jgi:hypothetical protein
VIDAKRLSDGVLVMLKRVEKGTKEIEIGEFLSSEPVRSDPQNHCVPYLDVLSDHPEPEKAFIVMPLLRKYDSPEFHNVQEVLDFVNQVLEARG